MNTSTEKQHKAANEKRLHSIDLSSEIDNSA